MATEREWWKSESTGLLTAVAPPVADRAWVWVDLAQPDEVALRSLVERFELDVHAVEDALDANLFPAYDDYGEFVAIAIRGLFTIDGIVESTPLLCLVGRSFLITLHQQDLPGLEFVIETAQSHRRTSEGGPDRMFGRLADAGSRRFEPVVGEIDTLLDDCETQALLGEQGMMAALQTVRRQVSRLRAVVRPQRSVLQSLVYAETEVIGETARRRLTDVLERHVRLDESLESARAMANGVMEIHRGAVAERTNEIMKVLTILSATLLPMTLIAGVYGMNFADMPGLDARFGFPLALVLMAGVGFVLWWYFARRGFVGGPKLGSGAAHVATRLADAATLPVRTVGSLITGNLKHAHGGRDQPS